MQRNRVLGCDVSVADLDVSELTAEALDRKTLHGPKRNRARSRPQSYITTVTGRFIREKRVNQSGRF